MKLLNSKVIINTCDKGISLWHKKGKQLEKASLDTALEILSFEKDKVNRLVNDSVTINSYLWHLEDRARAKSFSDSLIASVKRAIDPTNQRRNNKMEEIDAALLAILDSNGVKPMKTAGINTETPGSVVDRLAIISLKIYHMGEQVKRKDVDKEHRTKCSNRLSILVEQRKDLGKSLDELVSGLKKGSKKLKMYYQFKMYNDPATNPFMKK